MLLSAAELVHQKLREHGEGEWARWLRDTFEQSEPENSSVISIRFKHPPQQLFRKTQIEQIEPNWIVLGTLSIFLRCWFLELQHWR